MKIFTGKSVLGCFLYVTFVRDLVQGHKYFCHILQKGMQLSYYHFHMKIFTGKSVLGCFLSVTFVCDLVQGHKYFCHIPQKGGQLSSLHMSVKIFTGKPVRKPLFSVFSDCPWPLYVTLYKVTIIFVIYPRRVCNFPLIISIRKYLQGNLCTARCELRAVFRLFFVLDLYTWPCTRSHTFLSYTPEGCAIFVFTYVCQNIYREAGVQVAQCSSSSSPSSSSPLFLLQ